MKHSFSPSKYALYEKTRYETTRWPLWRWDQNLRYIIKSFAHRPHPATQAEADHHQAQATYLSHKTWLPPSSSQASCAAIGDLMWLRAGYKNFLSPGIKQDFTQAHAIFANMETPLDHTQKVQTWTFETLHYNAPLDYLDAWSCTPDSTPKIFSLCNNHALDQGITGLHHTRQNILARQNMHCLGGPGGLQEAVHHFTLHGHKIAVIATTFGINHEETFDQVPEGIPRVIFGSPTNKTQWDRVQALLDLAHQQDPDWIIMMPHWGYEYEYWPDQTMRADAHRLLKMGFDIILGSSPHVLQPVELVSLNGWDPKAPTQLQRPGPARPGLIAYSLGDFASVIPTVACQTGAILHFTLDRTQDGTPTLSGLHATPTITGRMTRSPWINAGTSTLDEFTQTHPTQTKPLQHAQRILGPLLQALTETQ